MLNIDMLCLKRIRITFSRNISKMRHIVHSVIKKSYLRFCRSISMFDLQIYEKLKKISRFLMGIVIF